MININIGIADNFQSERVFTKKTINQSSAPIPSPNHLIFPVAEGSFEDGMGADD
jgi:hypothetical protein